MVFSILFHPLSKWRFLSFNFSIISHSGVVSFLPDSIGMVTNSGDIGHTVEFLIWLVSVGVFQLELAFPWVDDYSRIVFVVRNHLKFVVPG